MQHVKSTLVWALAAIVAALALSPVASADTGIVEESGVEISPPEHVLMFLSTGTWLYESSNGVIACNQVLGEASMDEAHVDGVTDIGDVTAFDTLNNGSQNCPTTIFGISSCNPTYSTPYLLAIDPNNPGPALLVIADFAVHFDCASILGTIECEYGPPDITGEIGAGTNVVVFDDHLQRLSGSALCPSEVIVEADLRLEDENGNPITYESTK